MSKNSLGEIPELVPILDQEVVVHSFGSSEYLLQHSTLHHQISVNQTTYQLLELVDGRRSITKLSEEYEQQHQVKLDAESIHYLLYEKLAKYGIIKQEEYKVEKRKRASYLKLSFILLKQAHVQAMTRYLTWLFHPKVFYVLLIATSLFVSIIIARYYSVITDNMSMVWSGNFVLYLAVFQLGTLFHELGHAAACRRFGASHGGIGFGFYLLTPVFFADVSDAWKLPVRQRIVVNLAGVYMELLVATIFLIGYVFTAHIGFLVIPCLLILSTLYNLNPLLRFDGYWVLADATHTPNLQKRAFETLKEKLSQLKKLRINFSARKEVFLFVYGLLSAGFIFFFLGSVLLYDPDAIFKFPINIYKVATDWRVITWSKFQTLIIPVVFWYLVLRVVWSKRKRLFSFKSQ